MATVEVSKETFFKVIGPLNVHPRSEPDHSRWEMLNNRQFVGRSEPGYKSAHGTPHRYWLEQSYTTTAP
uniref:Uncharacterized protein n=1 Tax=Pseudomonas phage Touem01 TaxID=3138548 RepID=A0AAU6W1T5_9VIRU